MDKRVWKGKMMGPGDDPWGRRRKTSKGKQLSEIGRKSMVSRKPHQCFRKKHEHLRTDHVEAGGGLDKGCVYGWVGMEASRDTKV